MTDRKPNVIVIIMDDLTYGDLSCHGNPYTQTPRLDQLRSESTRLERYCTGTLSTPARASLMTGRYHLRTRAIDTYCGRAMIDPDEITLANVLGDAGYATCLSGKWHLGDCYPSRPTDMGFDESLNHNSGGLGQPGNPGLWPDRPANPYVDPMLMHNGEPVPSKGYCTDIFASHAIEFIEAHRDGPFFCYLATNAPHGPLIAPEGTAQKFIDMGIDKGIANCYGMVENIDHNVGRVLDKLDELGIADDTIVVYTSDHGKEKGSGRFNSHLRGGKGTPYDGGMRTPCFWRWPGRIVPDRSISNVANPIDFLPTIAAAAGAKAPDDRVIDGTNLLPLLTGEVAPADWPQRHCFVQWHRGDAPVRYRNCAVVGDRYKWVSPTEDAATELYDTQADPGEQTDLADDQPDRIAAMRDLYDAWFDDVSSTRPNNYAPPPIVVGTEHETLTRLSRQDWRVHGEDGWNDQTEAHWEVRIAGAGDFAVTIDYTPGDDAGTLHLSHGDVRATADAPAGASRATIDRLALPDGDANVECWLERAGERIAVREVTLSRAE